MFQRVQRVAQLAENLGALRALGCAERLAKERNFSPPKLPPAGAARAALDGVERGLEEVYPGDMATGMSQGLASDPKAVEKDLAKYLPTSP